MYCSECVRRHFTTRECQEAIDRVVNDTHTDVDLRRLRVGASMHIEIFGRIYDRAESLRTAGNVEATRRLLRVLPRPPSPERMDRPVQPNRSGQGTPAPLGPPFSGSEQGMQLVSRSRWGRGYGPLGELQNNDYGWFQGSNSDGSLRSARSAGSGELSTSHPASAADANRSPAGSDSRQGSGANQSLAGSSGLNSAGNPLASGAHEAGSGRPESVSPRGYPGFTPTNQRSISSRATAPPNQTARIRRGNPSEYQRTSSDQAQQSTEQDQIQFLSPPNQSARSRQGNSPSRAQVGESQRTSPDQAQQSVGQPEAWDTSSPQMSRVTSQTGLLFPGRGKRKGRL